MFIPVNWKTFVRDFIVIQIGFALYGLSIALLIQANLGTSPWVTLSVALSNLTAYSVGIWTNLIGAAVLVGVLLVRHPIGWGTIANILFIGPWVDVFLDLIPSMNEHLGWQVALLLASVIVIGAASAVYIGVNAGAGPRDSLMIGLSHRTGWQVGAARATIEIIILATGWALGGPVGVGTVIFALLVGPSVQWWFKLLNVKPHTSPIVEEKVATA